MRVLHLYRPRLPGLRAQAIQVVHTCHALARLGHEVTLLADRGEAGGAAGGVLQALDLVPVAGLEIRIAPLRHSGLAGLWFRRELARWWRGPSGVVLARDKRRLCAAVGRHGRKHRVVLETHELDSALAREAARPVSAVVRLEQQVLELADALIANCGGTLRAWETHHGPALPEARKVIHNAASPSRRRDLVPKPDPVVRAVGSLRAYKGPDLLVSAAADFPLPLELIGGSEAERLALGPLPANVRVLGALPYPDVPGVLARSQVLVLPLLDNFFGRHLSSPLKLWDYLATAAPVVAPDLPTVREIAAIAQTTFHLHRPGDVADLARAVSEAAVSAARVPFVRTWDQRAREVEAMFG